MMLRPTSFFQTLAEQPGTCWGRFGQTIPTPLFNKGAQADHHLRKYLGSRYLNYCFSLLWVFNFSDALACRYRRQALR